MQWLGQKLFINFINWAISKLNITYIYKGISSRLGMTAPRLKRNKQRGMSQRKKGNKKPMKPEEKEENKKNREAQSASQKILNEKAKAAKVVKKE